MKMKTLAHISNFSKSPSSFLTFALLISPMALHSCKTRTGDYRLEGLYASNSAWPNATASTCFLATSDATEQVRAYVRRVVDVEINQVTPFTFTGFKTCDGSKVDIIIKINHRAEPKSSIGRAPNFYNFYFEHGQISKGRIILNFPPDFKDQRNDDFLHNTTIHEFGHALGLHHELRRKDATCSALENPEGPAKNGVPVGPYDPDSIMNYCNQLYQSTKVTLSKGDLATINEMYPTTASTRRPATPLRCRQAELIECIAQESNETCIDQSCQGGDFYCRNGEILKKCVSSHGGKACLSPRNGDCRER